MLVYNLTTVCLMMIHYTQIESVHFSKQSLVQCSLSSSCLRVTELQVDCFSFHILAICKSIRLRAAVTSSGKTYMVLVLLPTCHSAILLVYLVTLLHQLRIFFCTFPRTVCWSAYFFSKFLQASSNLFASPWHWTSSVMILLLHTHS